MGTEKGDHMKGSEPLRRGPFRHPPYPVTNSAFASCPVCGGVEVRRLAEGWDDGRPVPIVDGCGNPWHYTTESLGDAPSDAPEKETTP